MSAETISSLVSPRNDETRTSPLPSFHVERALFFRLRKSMVLTTVGQALSEARIRVLFVVLLTVAFWAIMFGLFYEGFGLLQSAINHPPTLARTVHTVYSMFFLSLLVMLGLSSGILYYAAVYKSPEVALLLTLPIRAERIALQKLQETTVLACWGFLLLGSPLLMAYGLVTHAPWTYYLFLLPLLVAFSVVASGLGACGCLLLVAAAPQVRRAVLVLLAIGLLGSVTWLIWTLMSTSSHQILSPLWLQTALERLSVSERRLYPSWWLSTGLLEASHGSVRGTLQAVGFTCVLSSNALVVWATVGQLGQWLLRRSYGQLTSGPRISWPWRLDALDRSILLALRPLSPAMRYVLLKDLRLFRRDPLQWSQFLLFFGLLAFYFLYVRKLDYGRQLVGWMTAVGFMNLAVAGLILSTFTTRFVFPLISVEGQRFWILGTAPVRRRDILWAKFIFAILVTSVPCCVLVFLSDIALQLLERTPAMTLLHQCLCLQLSVGLSGLAVGLGARFPNLRESSPAKIAAGFGGTLTLILSALFVLLTIIPPAIPAYLFYTSYDLSGEATSWTSDSRLLWGLSGSLAATVLTTWIPLQLGFRAFARMEIT